MSRRESGEIQIAAEPEELWQLLTRVADIPTWYDDWDEAEATSGSDELVEGAAFRLIKRGLLRLTAECTVVGIEPTVRVRWIEHRPLHAPVLVEFELLPDEGKGTVLRHSKTVGTLSGPSADTGRQSS